MTYAFSLIRKQIITTMITKLVYSQFRARVCKHRKSVMRKKTFIGKLIYSFSNLSFKKKTRLLEKSLQKEGLLNKAGIVSLVNMYSMEADNVIRPEVILSISSIIFTAYIFIVSPFAQIGIELIKDPGFSSYLSSLTSLIFVFLIPLILISIGIAQISKDSKNGTRELIKVLRHIEVKLNRSHEF